MLPTDSRFVVWSKCACGSSFTSFRGHKDIVAIRQCPLQGFNVVCDLVLFDARHKNRVRAFIFRRGRYIPPRLESVGGWSCPVFEMSDEDIACIGAHPQSRFKSERKRRCRHCMSANRTRNQFRHAKTAFLRWKSKCRFVYG